MHNLISSIWKSWRLKKASKIPTHLTVEEKIALFNSSCCCGGDAVEIGSYLGASSCYIAEGLLCQGKGTLHCVDTWKNDAMSEGHRDTFREFQSNTVFYKNIIVPYRGHSAEIARNFGRKISFLFVDADHSYDGVREDWLRWSPFLEPNSFVALHDIGWAEGVKRVLEEFVLPRTASHVFLPNLFIGRAV
jgi:predicted O-methyltransferase YrrM